MGFDDIATPGLVLGLGFSSAEPKKPFPATAAIKEPLNLEPSLTLSLSGDPFDKVNKKLEENNQKVLNDQNPVNLYRQDSAASSFSNISVKRERDNVYEEIEIERVGSRLICDEDDDGSNGRKKLRLTKPQYAMLEESFKHRSTLTPKQKQDLARELNLRPRQVEVWFQNRRARTKLKQTEVDCEFLKKCCETLTDENRRLQKELQELKALKVANPFCMKLPAASLTMCPSCEKIAGVGDKASKSPFTMAPKTHLFNPFPNQSAAC